MIARSFAIENALITVHTCYGLRDRLRCVQAFHLRWRRLSSFAILYVHIDYKTFHIQLFTVSHYLRKVTQRSRLKASFIQVDGTA